MHVDSKLPVKKRVTGENKNKKPEYLKDVLGSARIMSVTCRHFYVIGKSAQSRYKRAMFFTL